MGVYRRAYEGETTVGRVEDIWILALLTCHNRREQTLSCIRSLEESAEAASGGGRFVGISFVVVDAGSTDGTCDALEALKGEGVDLRLLRRGDDLYWNAGMRVAMNYAAAWLRLRERDFSYVMLINDDVLFQADALDQMLSRMRTTARDEGAVAATERDRGVTPPEVRDEDTAASAGEREDAAAAPVRGAAPSAGVEDPRGAEAAAPGSGERPDGVVGATCDTSGRQTYGGVRMRSRRLARYELIAPSEEAAECDTCNCNALLLRPEAFLRTGNLDAAYKHSMGDYDYGMRLRRRGYRLVNTPGYVGVCEGNPQAGSWRDPTLPRAERLRRKESAKGLPARDWYHFIRKNYSLPAALYHSLTPYVRILIGR